MAKSEISYLRELFEAHLGPIRDDMREIKASTKDAFKAAQEAREHAESAHRKIDSASNLTKGLLLGSGFGGGTIGAMIMKYWPFQ